MKKLLIPILLLVAGTGTGVGAAFLLKPEEAATDDMAAVCACADGEVSGKPAANVADEVAALAEPTEFAKLNNQFVIPVVAQEKIAAMVVITLSIEVAAGNKDVIFQAEPKLRDGFLQVLFDHANIGGFSGNFTTSTNMRILRQELLRSARSVVGENALDILILDIVRQDI